MPYRLWTFELSDVMWWFKSLPKSSLSRFCFNTCSVELLLFTSVIIVQILITCMVPPCDYSPNSNYSLFGINKCILGLLCSNAPLKLPLPTF